MHPGEFTKQRQTKQKKRAFLAALPGSQPRKNENAMLRHQHQICFSLELRQKNRKKKKSMFDRIWVSVLLGPHPGFSLSLSLITLFLFYL